MSVGFSSKPNSCMHATTLLLAAFFCYTVQSFKPDPGHFNTPHEAIEYVAWKALKDGKPSCVTVHPLGVSLFCIMGECIQDGNGSSYCKCSQYFTGLTCSVYKGKCASESICSPHLCQDNPNKISLYECVCKPGYHVPDSPAFSHCMPDSILSSAMGEKYSESSTNATTLPSTVAPDEQLAETSMLLNISEDNTRTSANPVTTESNASQPALKCRSSGFNMHFIQQDEENKTADVFTRAFQNDTGQDEPSETTRAVETNSHSTVLKNQQYPAAYSIDDRDKTKEETEKNATKSHVGLNSVPVTVALSDYYGSLVSEPRQHSKRGVKLQVPVIQRRCASTFQREQDGTFETQLTLDDLTTYKADSEQGGVDKYHMPISSHPGDQVTELEHIMSSTAVPLQPLQKESLNEDGEDYEVTQFRKRLLKMAAAKLFRNEGNNDNLLLRPAAYLAASETKRKQARKSYMRHKQLPVEAQDDIIDSLKHAVEVDEYRKTNSTSKPGHDSEMTERTIMVPERRKRRKSSLLQENGAVDKASTEQKQLAVSSVIASEKRKEMSKIMQQHKSFGYVGHFSEKNQPQEAMRPGENHERKISNLQKYELMPVGSVRQNFSESNYLQEATYRPGKNYEIKIGNLQKYNVMPVMNWTENTLSQNRDKMTHMISDAISWKNEKLGVHSILPDAGAKWVHKFQELEVQHQVTSTTKDQLSTCCNNSSMLTSDSRSKTSLAMKQSFLDKSIHWNISKFIKNQTELSHKSHLLRVQDNVMVKDAKTNDKVTPKHQKTKGNHFTGKNPMLFFNVTVLNDGGRNKSSASYLVPFAGSGAIMMSWGIYNDSSS
ncbi:uncharacterized protein [Dermacentor andersoni]|uniref:uncharacterized protein n=1 Tax=Dermacentor andersoni TaxID=34620 RepID=UPI0021552D4E|nr:uncharacterized protein LOC126544474 [Dermacentor andersoni]